MTFPNWLYFFTDIKPLSFKRKGYMSLIKPDGFDSSIIKIPSCAMAGQKHSRDFYLYSITRVENHSNPENDIFKSSAEDLKNEVLYLDTVAKYIKQNRSVRAKAKQSFESYIPATFNRQKYKKRKLSYTENKKDLFDKDFLMTLDEKSNQGNFFPSNIKTIYEKGIFLSNSYKLSHKFNKMEISSVSDNFNTIKMEKQIEKLILLKESDGTTMDTKSKIADLKKIAKELLDFADEIENKSVLVEAPKTNMPLLKNKLNKY